jgi:hypothetical protein
VTTTAEQAREGLCTALSAGEQALRDALALLTPEQRRRLREALTGPSLPARPRPFGPLG